MEETILDYMNICGMSEMDANVAAGAVEEFDFNDDFNEKELRL